jgi:CheY-like chemotaxis protein
VPCSSALLQPKTIPIVAVTAFAMVGDRERILARGFDGYIPKPITPESFVHTVESYMSEPLLAGATKAAP